MTLSVVVQSFCAVHNRIPYLHHLLPAFNIQQARETAVAGFLMQCDSSRITRRHSYERRPGPLRPDLLFEASSSPCIVPSEAMEKS